MADTCPLCMSPILEPLHQAITEDAVLYNALVAELQDSTEPGTRPEGQARAQ